MSYGDKRLIKYPLHSVIVTTNLGSVEVIEVLNEQEMLVKPVYILYNKNEEFVYIAPEGEIVEKEI